MLCSFYLLDICVGLFYHISNQDKWRNVGPNHGQGCGANAVMTMRKGKATATNVVMPETENSSPVFVSRGNSDDKPPQKPQDVRDATKYVSPLLCLCDFPSCSILHKFS